MATVNNKIKYSNSDRIFGFVNGALLCLLMFVLIYPMYFCLVASFSDPDAVAKGTVTLWPQGFTLDAYRFAMEQSSIWTGYANTIYYTLFGTIWNLFLTIPCAYFMSKKNLPGHGFFAWYFLIPMYFGGGMIPTYIVANTLNLVNTRLIMILFGSISVYNIILIRTFFSSNIPDEMREAAFIDGCTNTRFFMQFAMPLSKAIIAVIALYIAVGHWNNYYTALVYTTDRSIQPLQLYLRRLLLISVDNGETADPNEAAQMTQLVQVIRYAVIVISTLPIMCLYPFLQKYFVQGVMIGSLKG